MSVVEITNKTQWEAMSSGLAGDYKLMNNINFGGSVTCIGLATYSSFTGTLDGQGYTVSNATVTVNTSNSGLFYGLNGGTIKNLNTSTITISGRARSGIIVGISQGTWNIINCHVSGGSVTPNQTTSMSGLGGIVGYTYASTGLIQDCTSSAGISVGTHGSNSDIGGITGRCNGGVKIIRCSTSGTTTNGQYIGGLVGTCTGYIAHCFSTRTNNGTGFFIGGFAGAMTSGGTMEYCYSTGNSQTNTTGGDGEYKSAIVGGFIGYMNASTISNCYAHGNATSTTNINEVGGFVGRYGGGTITNCYSKGAVSSSAADTGGFTGRTTSSGITVNCFWDTTTSGKATSNCAATGRTTAQMQTQATFTGAGWNFTQIWKMSGYPAFIANYGNILFDDANYSAELQTNFIYDILLTDEVTFSDEKIIKIFATKQDAINYIDIVTKRIVGTSVQQDNFTVEDDIKIVKYSGTGEHPRYIIKINGVIL